MLKFSAKILKFMLDTIRFILKEFKIIHPHLYNNQNIHYYSVYINENLKEFL